MRTCSVSGTVKLLCECWMQAEWETSKQIRERHFAGNEEFITTFFCNLLDEQLKAATKDRRLAKAFEEDLIAAFPLVYRGYPSLDPYSHDLCMICRRHNKREEGKTGGDFGLTVLRPSIETSTFSARIKMKLQGLLCQAKLRGKNDKWRLFSPSQKKVLPDKMAFLGLLLYEYADSDRKELGPFRWEPCLGASIEEVAQWLKTDRFPNAYDSRYVINAVASGQLGTSDSDIIRRVIALETQPLIEIRIDWPDGRKPPPLSQLIEQQEPAVQKIHVYNVR